MEWLLLFLPSSSTLCELGWKQMKDSKEVEDSLRELCTSLCVVERVLQVSETIEKTCLPEVLVELTCMS